MPIERISSSIFVARLASYCKPILPVPTLTILPKTIAADGFFNLSTSPLIAASVKNAVAVSYVIFKNGDVESLIPTRENGLYPPCWHMKSEINDKCLASTPMP